ncbi:hypothetical protein AKJ41_01270 [candidate division MSBL1 archaeon SCGC-AAA259O05]|uniref:Uncharacterized protein n=1 Tax=candidate division MSBL1 archaeon SCGC-AAA259O05 TaxID=1698271 RepID=A0A133V505_9EURY|nr:hypothetical protein AKJ41_01270 [candidate division MSBL1 archaeon SCGC-AAA259O05]
MRTVKTRSAQLRWATVRATATLEVCESPVSPGIERARNRPLSFAESSEAWQRGSEGERLQAGDFADRRETARKVRILWEDARSEARAARTRAPARAAKARRIHSRRAERGKVPASL